MNRFGHARRLPGACVKWPGSFRADPSCAYRALGRADLSNGEHVRHLSAMAGRVRVRWELTPKALLLHWEETADLIERTLAEEKHLFPNLDWPSGRLYYALGLEVPLYTPIFVMSRITGWSAHIIEQLGRADLAKPKNGESWTRVIIEKPFGHDGASARERQDRDPEKAAA